MNNFDQYEKIEQEILKHTPRELAKRIIWLEENINKIKAEAVRDWADQAQPNNESEDRMVNSAYDYANKLEKGEV